MAIRTSIELHPDGCRIVEIATARDADVVVRTFVPAVGDGRDASTVTEALARLRRERKLHRHAWVTIWGLRSTQQLLRLPPAPPADLEALALREARKDIAPLETGADGVSVVVMPGAEIQSGSQRRREVSLVAVANADVRDHLQPVIDAGFVVEGVVTPALALAALARGRRDAVRGSTAAYVAVGGRATCLAVIRDGVLLFAREMAWGHAGSAGEAVDARMASELKRSILYFKQTFRASVDAVVLCGDMPNLRAVTQPLGDALGVPVEALDSLVGVDAGAVPEPADAFRATVAALRVAIAAAADPAATANLLPAAIRKAREAKAEIRRMAAALVAGLVLAAIWLYVARGASDAVHRIAVDLEEQLSVLDGAAAQSNDVRAAHAIAASREAALQSFDTQGPRLARLLEAIAQSAPEPLVIRSIGVTTAESGWRVEVTGLALAGDAATSQAAVRAFLSRMAASAYAGAPARSPSFRVLSGGGRSPADVPDGSSGVEFAAEFSVAR